LDIGGKAPGEVALSILAEIVATRSGKLGAQGARV
jgi:xanthine/CO dehydrogenase XdhC/CoxF family maturation factor